MNDAAKELKQTAKINKKHLKGASLITKINNDSYALQVSGIGEKSIRLSLFISYDDLIKYKNHRKLEKMIYDKIVKVYPEKKKGTIWRAL